MVAPLAAAIHLGYFPPRVESDDEFRFLRRQFLPFVQGLKATAGGILFPVGQGSKGEEVYILATGKKPDLLLKTLGQMLPLFGEDPLNYRFINCQAYLSLEKNGKAQKDPGRWGWYNRIGQLVGQVQRGLL